jgi:hypothetical protein
MDPPRRRRRVGKVTFQPKKDTGVVAGRLMPAAHGKGGWLQCAAGERGALEVSAARAAHWWRGRRRRAVSAVGCSECDFSGFLAAHKRVRVPAAGGYEVPNERCSSRCLLLHAAA